MRTVADGHTLSTRTLAVLADAADAAKVPRPRVLQGSWSKGGLSAGTHEGGGAVDVSVRGLDHAQQVRLVTELRRRNAVAWLRTEAYGWQDGDHLHAIVRDEPGLSVAAEKQVHAYDLNRNGLANRGRDPHPRPMQHPIEEVRLMAWPVGDRKIIKPDKAVKVQGGQFVTLATITLPKGAAFDCSLQVRMPAGVGAGEAHLARVGWGTASRGQLDETGHNPVPPASSVEAWRHPIMHNIEGGGPVAFRLWLPPGTHTVRFVAKAIRTH